MTDYFYVFPREDEREDDPIGVAYAPSEMAQAELEGAEMPPADGPPVVLQLREGACWASEDAPHEREGRRA